jgi:hypothetical protein
MQSWYKVEMPFAEGSIGGKGKRLYDLFTRLFIAKAGVNPRVAMFTNHDDNNYETIIYYFSP